MFRVWVEGFGFKVKGFRDRGVKGSGVRVYASRGRYPCTPLTLDVSQIRGPSLGKVLPRRIMVCWVLYWGLPIYGSPLLVLKNCQISTVVGENQCSAQLRGNSLGLKDNSRA